MKPKPMYYKPDLVNGRWLLLCKEGQRGDWHYYTDLSGRPKQFDDEDAVQKEAQELAAVYGPQGGAYQEEKETYERSRNVSPS